MRRIALMGCLIWGCAVYAADPILDFVYPAGGMPGGEFEIEVGGMALSDLVQAVFSGSGVKATLLGPVRTVTYSRKGRPITTVVPNRFRFKVVAEKEAAPGLRALRVASAYRLSEPVGFDVSDMPELVEPFTNRASASEYAVDALPVCLNGRIDGSAGDRYRVQAKKGSTLVAFTDSGALPKGGFRPVLTFTDPAGKPCEGVTVYDSASAPVVVFEVPQDGPYTLHVASASGTGGDACVYRVKFGELPLVTGFSPPGAKEGESLNVKLIGHNLPQKRVRLFTGGKNSALCQQALTEGAFALPALRFEVSEESDEPEKEPNDTSETAQALELPCVISGHLAAEGGRDLYRFSGKKGDLLYVDVRAQVLGSPLKPRVTVRGSSGEVVAEGVFDTNATVRAAVCGRDPSVPLTLPEEGAYEVEVSDLEKRSGDGLFYRLRLGPPKPDFQLWMTPASLNIPSDGSALVTLHLNRIHGFSGEVRVGLDFPPLSIACEGGMMPAQATMTKMTVSTEGVRYPRTVFGLTLTGAAQIEGREVRRMAVPISFSRDAGGLLERGAYGELAAKVGAGVRGLRVDPLGKGGVPLDPRIPMPVAFSAPVQVGVKEPVRLNVLSATMATHLGGLYVPAVVWPPRGFTVTGVQPTNKQERAGVLLQADAAVVKPGETGYFILGCYTKGDTNKTVTVVTQSVPFVVVP